MHSSRMSTDHCSARLGIGFALGFGGGGVGREGLAHGALCPGVSSFC